MYCIVCKKKPFLSDPKFLKYKGFESCDEADNGVHLWYLPFEKEAEPDFLHPRLRFMLSLRTFYYVWETKCGITRQA